MLADEWRLIFDKSIQKILLLGGIACMEVNCAYKKLASQLGWTKNESLVV